MPIGNPVYVPLIGLSIAFNYFLGRLISKQLERKNPSYAKNLLITGIVGNLALLGYFKYTDFFISSINTAGSFGAAVAAHHLALGISFFTFTQICIPC